MVCRISFRDFTYEALSDGFNLIVTTDVPCHIYCRMTLREPGIHTRAVLVRGLALKSELGFCFTVFEDNEQIEPGDTLVHTFEKRSWPFCQTRWFYFYGSIAGEFCVSTSAIFKLHNSTLGPPPMPTLLLTEPWTWDSSPFGPVYAKYYEEWLWLKVDPPVYTLTYTETW